MSRLWRLLAGHRDLRLLLGANLVSSSGDWILRTGLAYQIYVLTGSTLASAAAVLASLIPQIALGSIAGVYADRWDRRRTMVVTNLLLATVLIPLLFVRDAGEVWLVYAVMAASSCLAPFFASAEQALLPSLVPGGDLITANSLNGQVRDVARLIGAALGGVVAAVGGIALLAVVDMLTFALAAALLMLIRRRSAPTPGQVRAHVLREWIDGVRVALASRTLKVILAFSAILGLGEAAMSTLMAPFVADVLHGDARAYGLILSAQAIGGIAGGALTTWYGHRFDPRALLGWGTVAFGVIDLAMFLYPLVHRVLWPAPVLMVIVGLPSALLIAGLLTLFQTATDDAHRGRVFGAIVAVDAASMLAGTIAAGALAERIGIVPVIAAQGVGPILAGLLVLVALPRADRVRQRPMSLAVADRL